MGKNRNKEINAALYKRLEPLLPIAAPSPKGGRPRLSDEQALNRNLYVLGTGTPLEYLPQEVGFGSGMTCWRRLHNLQNAGAWHRLHLALLAELRNADKLDLSRACLDGASSRRGRTQGTTLRSGGSSAANATSRTAKTSR